MMEPHYLGNMDLLTFRKVGFLASRKVNPTSVIPTINWANKVSHNPNAAIISGFQSTLECEVLDIILKGTCGIIYVLNRSTLSPNTTQPTLSIRFKPHPFHIPNLRKDNSPFQNKRQYPQPVYHRYC